MRRRGAVGKRAGERILYPLTELRTLRGLVAGIPHRPAAFHNPLFETGDGPVNTALRKAEAEDRSAVDGILLRVAHELQRYGPRPGDGDEREPPLAEDRLRDRILRPRRRVEYGVVRPAKLTVGWFLG